MTLENFLGSAKLKKSHSFHLWVRLTYNELNFASFFFQYFGMVKPKNFTGHSWTSFIRYRHDYDNFSQENWSKIISFGSTQQKVLNSIFTDYK